jgi:cytochrome P450
MRRPLQRALTIKSVQRSAEVIRQQILRLLAPLADGGTFDFAQAMLAMPMAVTGVLMGLPREDWPRLTRLTTTCIAPDDPEYRHPDGRKKTLEAAHRELFSYFQDIVRARRHNLGDDLISILLRTEFEGRRMSVGETVSNCYSMLLGANVTTPHAPSFAFDHLIGTPELDDWAAHPELITSGVEEALRWASAAPSSRPGIPWWCGSRRPTATRPCSRIRSSSTSDASPTATSPSARAPTTVWGTASPG